MMEQLALFHTNVMGDGRVVMQIATQLGHETSICSIKVVMSLAISNPTMTKENNLCLEKRMSHLD